MSWAHDSLVQRATFVFVSYEFPFSFSMLISGRICSKQRTAKVLRLLESDIMTEWMGVRALRIKSHTRVSVISFILWSGLYVREGYNMAGLVGVGRELYACFALRLMFCERASGWTMNRHMDWVLLAWVARNAWSQVGVR